MFSDRKNNTFHSKAAMIVSGELLVNEHYENICNGQRTMQSQQISYGNEVTKEARLTVQLGIIDIFYPIFHQAPVCFSPHDCHD